MQIRTKLYFVIILGITLGVVSTSVLNFVLLRSEVAETLNMSEMALVRGIRSDIDNKLSAIRQTAELVRFSEDTYNYLHGTDAGGSGSEKTLMNVRMTLYNIRKALPAAAHISLADMSGRVLLSTSGYLGDVSANDCFVSAVSGRIADGLARGRDGKPRGVYTLAAPVRNMNQDGKMSGVVLVDVDVQSFLEQKVIDAFKYDERNFMFMLDSSGSVLLDAGSSALSADLDMRAISQTAAAEQNGYLRHGDGTLFFANVQRAKWFLVSYSKNSNLYQPLIAFRNLSSGIYLILLAIAAFAANSLVRSIIPRLKAGVSFADNVVAGDISGRLDDSGGDELGRLFRAINVMVDHLRQALNEAKVLEQKAKEAGDELFLQNSQLEMIVLERTMDLEEAQRHTKLILDLATEAIFEIDKEDIITFANSTAEDMMGYEKEEMLGLNFFSAVRHSFEEGEILPDETSPLRKAVASGRKESIYNLWVVGRHDNFIPASVSISPIVKYGITTGTIIAIIDLTEVTRTSMIMQAVYDNTEEGYIFFSDDFRPFDCNKAIVKLFSASEKSRILENFMSFSPPFQPSGLSSEARFEAIRNGLLESGHERFEWTHLDANGREIPCIVTMTFVKVNKQMIIMVGGLELSISWSCSRCSVRYCSAFSGRSGHARTR